VGGGPGRDVLSTWWEAGKSNQYATDAGTSMAAPHVAGVLALVLAQGLAPAAAVQRVLASVTPLPCGGTCRGEVDAARAVGAARAGPTTTAPSAGRSGTGQPARPQSSPPGGGPAVAPGSGSTVPDATGVGPAPLPGTPSPGASLPGASPGRPA